MFHDGALGDAIQHGGEACMPISYLPGGRYPRERRTWVTLAESIEIAVLAEKGDNEDEDGLCLGFIRRHQFVTRPLNGLL